MKPLFHYSGSKRMLAKKYPQLPKGQLIELFAGSMGYSFYYERPAIGFEINPRIVGVYDYLKEVEPAVLLSFLEELQTKAEVLLCDLNLTDRRFIDFLSLNYGGVVTGRLGKNKLLPSRRKLNLEAFECALYFYKEHITVYQVDTLKYAPLPRKDCVYFIDPPYGEFNYPALGALLKKMTPGRFIFTYGDGAEQQFKDMKFYPVSRRSFTVPSYPYTTGYKTEYFSIGEPK